MVDRYLQRHVKLIHTGAPGQWQPGNPSAAPEAYGAGSVISLLGSGLLMLGAPARTVGMVTVGMVTVGSRGRVPPQRWR